MDWTRFVYVVAGAGIVTSFSDWFFAGDWLHRRFTYPEIWRKGSEARAIAITALLPFLTAAAFAFTANRLTIDTVHSAVKFAAAVWVIGPLPLILTNAAFMKLHRVFVASYAIGWLVKLMIIAVLVGRYIR